MICFPKDRIPPETVIFSCFQHTGFLLLRPQCGERHYGLSILQGRFFDCLWDSVAYLERNAGLMDLRKKWVAGWLVHWPVGMCVFEYSHTPLSYCFFCFPRSEHLVEVEAMERRLCFIDALAGWFSFDFLHWRRSYAAGDVTRR